MPLYNRDLNSLYTSFTCFSVRIAPQTFIHRNSSLSPRNSNSNPKNLNFRKTLENEVCIPKKFSSYTIIYVVVYVKCRGLDRHYDIAGGDTGCFLLGI